MTTIDNTEIKYDRITRDYAVLVDGVAVAYGRNYSDAEAKRTTYLAERDADGLAATATELDGGAVEMPSTCQNCKGPHHIQACPQIRIVLFAPPHCSQCGDPMDWSSTGLCHLCRDWSEPVVMVVDVEYHIVSQSPFCAEPDNQCSVHNPCPAHAAAAARYLAQRSLTTWQPAELLTEDLPF